MKGARSTIFMKGVKAVNAVQKILSADSAGQPEGPNQGTSKPKVLRDRGALKSTPESALEGASFCVVNKKKHPREHPQEYS